MYIYTPNKINIKIYDNIEIFSFSLVNYHILNIFDSIYMHENII